MSWPDAHCCYMLRMDREIIPRSKVNLNFNIEEMLVSLSVCYVCVYFIFLGLLAFLCHDDGLCDREGIQR